jgi:hypothetical protein
MRRNLLYIYLSLIGLVVTTIGCDRPTYRLTPLPAATTGIDFTNQLTENDTTNILYNEYLYNGGGIGIGDFDNNGLPDLFFGGNMVSSRLYLQLAPWKFRDVTEEAGLTTDRWITGINVHDVNGDGYEDIYLATLNPSGERDTPNLLFVSKGLNADGIPTFREAAAEYGIADPNYGTHSAWIDLEGDGDLDLYVLNNSLEEMSRKTLRGTDTSGRARSVDVVYENQLAQTGNTQFVETDRITMEGWGLGIVPQDFNDDGFTDLYIANDFISDDAYWISDGAGNLSSQTTRYFPHTSKNSMGVDVADLNNDGRPDIMTADMLPDDNLRLKTMFSDIPNQVDAGAERRGYVRQYVRNALQIGNPDGTYSDLAYLTGTAATDWSWTPLLADFDNNGHRDILISNGYPRDVTNRDFVDFAQTTAMFGDQETQYRATAKALNALAGVHQPNYIFANEGELNFRPSDWLPPDPTYSNGAAYVDLDRDGDLDLVTNNLNEAAYIYRNHSRERFPDSSHYLQLQLEGPSGNPDALGTKVYLTYGGDRHAYAEQQRQRGYLSTMDALLHFGLGAADRIDSLLIVWPDGRTTERTQVAGDTLLTFDHAHSLAPAPRRPNWSRPPLPKWQPLAGNYPTHRESPFSDFDSYALAVRDRSHNGPTLATADLDGDGRDELIMGGAAGQPVTIYRQEHDSLTLYQTLEATTESEATVLLPLDYDGDGDSDLFIGNGSREFSFSPELYRDQLFENLDGKLSPAPGRLPQYRIVTGAAATADMDADGDADLFVGSAYATGRYPDATNSLVLRNDGGRFTVAHELAAGRITDASWTDLTGDGLPDLATVGDWDSPTVWEAGDGAFTASPIGNGQLTGWWYSLTPGDPDGDGDTDLLAGNTGLNSYYQAPPDRPLRLRVADYDDNESLDPILMMYIGDKSYPTHPRNTLGRQLPGFKKQAVTYAQYGGWEERNMPDLGEDGYLLEARELRSAYLENDGTGRFTVHFLPNTGQTAPIRDALFLPDTEYGPAFLTVQNDYATEVLGGRLDAGTGFLLTLDEHGQPVVDSDYWSVRGDARSLVRLEERIVVGTNDGPLRMYTPATERSARVSLRSPDR